MVEESTDSSDLSLLIFSAADLGTLLGLVKTYESWSISKMKPEHDTNGGWLKSLAYTLSERRTHLLWRNFAVVSSCKALEQLSSTVSEASRALNEPKLAFVFTGQGAQWAQMGISLLFNNTFHKTLLECQNVLIELGCQWDIVGKLCIEQRTRFVDRFSRIAAVFSKIKDQRRRVLPTTMHNRTNSLGKPAPQSSGASSGGHWTLFRRDCGRVSFKNPCLACSISI